MNTGIMTLGELREVIARAHPDDDVIFDQFGLVWNGVLDSWRGVYAMPAIGWRHPLDLVDAQPNAARDLLQVIDQALAGERFTGYKGGEYTFDRDSPVHVDRYGESTGTALVGVRLWPGKVWLITAGEAP